MECKRCGRETDKPLCKGCWKLSKGYIDEYDAPKILKKQIKIGTYPLFVVWEHHDPRIIDDHYSEVYEKVHMIDTEEECLRFYNQSKRNNFRDRISITSYTYPQQINEGESLEIGFKKVIHHARKKISVEEIREINRGY
jgi:hypothetical protein